MSAEFQFCIPTIGKAVPTGADWVHEIKYDGYRLCIERDRQFAWSRAAAMTGPNASLGLPSLGLPRQRSKTAVSSSWSTAAVILGVNGVSDFNALHSGKHNAEVQSARSMCSRSMVTMSAICH
jgi:bifunctional non-homologous end joining protein LigD